MFYLAVIHFFINVIQMFALYKTKNAVIHVFVCFIREFDIWKLNRRHRTMMPHYNKL